MSTTTATNDLPSFLQQTSPNAFTLTLSASAAETMMLCPAKYSWSRITGIEAAAPRAGLNYGKAMHLALAHRYGNLGKSLKDIEADAIEILTKHFDANPQPAMGAKGKAEWRTMARALQSFHAYNEHYRVETWDVLGVEEPFDVELGTFEDVLGDGMPGSINVRFRGIRDLRVKWHDSIWVADHKTLREWSDLTKDEGKASFQFQGYAWVERHCARQASEALGKNLDIISCDAIGPDPRIGGVIGNYLIAREPYADPNRKPSPRDLPRDQFEREAYPFSSEQLDEWHSRAMGVARSIWQRWSEGEWPQHSTACAHWGRCEYYQLCWETDPLYRMSVALGADYRQRTPSPIDDIAEQP